MGEISGAIIAITLVMTAVFVPVTFMTGPVGVFYRQFGITMAMSIVLSGVVALTLTPVLCAMILKPHHDPASADALWAAGHAPAPLRPRRREGHAAAMPPCCAGSSRARLTMLVVAGFAFGIFLVNTRLPAGFIPLEDQGMIYGIIQTPPGSTLEYTNAKSHELQEIAKRDRRRAVGLLAGRLRGADRGPRLERRHLPHQPEALVRAQADLEADHRGARGERQRDRQRQARVLRAAGGAGLRRGRRVFRARPRQDEHDRTTCELGEVTDKFMAALSKRKEVKGLFTFFASNYPQYELVINNDVAMQKGVSIADAMDNLSIVSAAPGSRASSALASSTRFTCRRSRSSGAIPRISRTCSSRTTRGRWCRTRRS